jgi:hypothetical protein
MVTAIEAGPAGPVLVVAGNKGARLEGGMFVPWPTGFEPLRQARLHDVVRDEKGLTWVASEAGVFFTNGTAWGSLDERDGLLEKAVTGVHPAGKGEMWFARKSGGVTRYRASRKTPPAPALTVQTDQEYSLPELPEIIVDELVSFRARVVDLRTVVAKRQFRWQLFQGKRSERELADHWNVPTTKAVYEHNFKAAGDWTLAVQYIDRDLNYSAPALARMKVVLPWHANAALTVPAGAGAVGLLGWAIFARLLYVRKRREAMKLREEMLEQEKAARVALEAKNEELEEARLAVATRYWPMPPIDTRTSRASTARSSRRWRRRMATRPPWRTSTTIW